MHQGALALALRNQIMATTPVLCVESREVVRCEHCRLMQYRTSNSLCRRCHKPLDIEEPLQFAPQLVTSPSTPPSAEAGLQVAGQVRDIRRARHLSQRQLASRMMVPRTYISKIENGKAIPTLGSLERLALALGAIRAVNAMPRWRPFWPILSLPRLPSCSRIWTSCSGRFCLASSGTRPPGGAEPHSFCCFEQSRQAIASVRLQGPDACARFKSVSFSRVPRRG